MNTRATFLISFTLILLLTGTTMAQSAEDPSSAVEKDTPSYIKKFIADSKKEAIAAAYFEYNECLEKAASFGTSVYSSDVNMAKVNELVSSTIEAIANFATNTMATAIKNFADINRTKIKIAVENIFTSQYKTEINNAIKKDILSFIVTEALKSAALAAAKAVEACLNTLLEYNYSIKQAFTSTQLTEEENLWLEEYYNKISDINRRRGAYERIFKQFDARPTKNELSLAQYNFDQAQRALENHGKQSYLNLNLINAHHEQAKCELERLTNLDKDSPTNDQLEHAKNEYKEAQRNADAHLRKKPKRLR